MRVTATLPAGSKAASLASFVESLNLARSDEVSIHSKGGVISVNVKRRDGRVQSATTILGGRFQQMTAVDGGLTPAQRRRLVKELDR